MPAIAPAAALVIQAPDIGTPEIKHLARLVAADTIDALSAAATQAFLLAPARSLGGFAEFACHPRHVPALGFPPLTQSLACHIGQRTRPRVPGETAGSLARSGSLRFAPSQSLSHAVTVR